MTNKNKNKNNKKQKQNGGNIGKATGDMFVSTFNLGISIFKAMDGVMNMPRDLKNAIPPNIERNEPGKSKETEAVNLPEFDKSMIKNKK
jgi:hypothetical protein